jgi:4'-phosphopantetheinyl transferase
MGLQNMFDAADSSAPATALIWPVPLGAETLSLELLQRLSASERERASRFRFEADRRRFLLSHYALRRILANLLQADPAALTFRIGEYGRPELAGAFSRAMWFNLSHCSDLALVAVSRETPIGVDLEPLRLAPDALELGQSILNHRELQDVADANEPERSRKFLQYWTRKEALLKAIGTGISSRVPELDTFMADAPWNPLRVMSHDAVWTLQSFEISDRHVAAVAGRAGAIDIRRETWYWDRDSIAKCE